MPDTPLPPSIDGRESDAHATASGAPQATPGNPAEGSANLQSDVHADVHAGVHAGVHAASPADVHATQSEPHAGSASEPVAGVSASLPAPDGAAGGAAPGVAAPSLSPAECAQQLKALFPKLFAGAPKPVKLRIQVDIQARAPGVFTKAALSGYFRRHTGSTSYLIAVTKAPHRFDLDGQPAGEITAEHRQVALDELARRRANIESRRELEEQQRRNRAGLLHDYQSTTLTPANFCALKGVAVEELDGLLTLARAEFEERARSMPAMRERPAHAPNEPRRDSRPDNRGRRPR